MNPSPDPESPAIHRFPGRNHQFFLIRIIIPILSVGFWGSSTFAQEKDLFDTFSHYQSFLWLTAESKPTPALFSALDALGVSGTNVAGTASSQLHLKHKRPFYLDHVAGKGFLYLKDETWRAIYSDWRKERRLPGLSRPVNLFDPQVIKKARARIDQVLAPFGKRLTDGAPLALALDDEISFGRRNIPVDFGFSPACLRAFRLHLEHKYKNPEALARAWRTKGRPFKDVFPLTTAEIRRREFILDPVDWNFAPWADHRRFIEMSFAQQVKKLGDYAQSKTTKKIPVGFTGGSAPHPFSGIDWATMLKGIDFCEPYDKGGSRELVRSFAKEETIILRTLFEDHRHPQANQHELWDYYLRGDNGVIIWSSKDYFNDPEKLEPKPWAKRLTKTLRKLRHKSLDGWKRAQATQAQIAVIESSASNKAHWLLDGRLDGRNWINQLAQHEIEQNSQNLTRESWQKLLEDLHLDYVHVAARDLGRRDLSQFKVLVLPRTIALSNQAIEVIKRFATTKTVIADCQSGLFDENLKAREVLKLDKFFGIKRTGRKVNLRQRDLKNSLAHQANELRYAEPGIKMLQKVASTLRLEDTPCTIVNRHGKNGRSVYLNLLTYSYLSTRKLNQRVELLDELRVIFRIAGVRPFVEIRRKGNIPPIRIFHRQDQHADYIAVLRNWRQSSRPNSAKSLSNLRPIDIEILLPRAAVIEDILQTTKYATTDPNRPSRDSSIRVTLLPFEPLMFRLPR